MSSAQFGCCDRHHPGRLVDDPCNVPVVFHFRSGIRSARVIRLLEDTHGSKNLVNLEGGILAFQEKVAPELARY